MSARIVGDMKVGDRVEVGSLWAVRPARNRVGRRAEGTIERFSDLGVVIRFSAPINGTDWCTASASELSPKGLDL
ncbi:Uncharacterised protein [Mycobacteroides abscessus subsp. abscessus]|nr:Uncharacterised protein [Mycobacteroides abscessus subsp. abscessus]